MEKIHDLEERYALEVQIGEFGQVPKQLFASPHPARIIFEGKYLNITELSNLKCANLKVSERPSKVMVFIFLAFPHRTPYAVLILLSLYLSLKIQTKFDKDRARRK